MVQKLMSERNLTMNSTYQEKISASLENSRNCLHRIARHDHTECSPLSILNVIEKFVKAVNAMDETILVPSRLMDQKVADPQDPIIKLDRKTKDKNVVQEAFNATDLFEIYRMVKNVKDGLLWGKAVEDIVEQPNFSSLAATMTIKGKGHVRTPSTASVASTSSASSLCDTDSELSSAHENDSGIYDIAVPEECSTERIAHDFQRHLGGLTHSLRQLTEAAQYLSRRYQHDMGSSN